MAAYPVGLPGRFPIPQKRDRAFDPVTIRTPVHGVVLFHRGFEETLEADLVVLIALGTKKNRSGHIELHLTTVAEL